MEAIELASSRDHAAELLLTSSLLWTTSLHKISPLYDDISFGQPLITVPVAALRVPDESSNSSARPSTSALNGTS